jgi:FixJ family two-component response regulator
MSNMSGLDLQRELAAKQHNIPIVFITAQRDKNVRPQLLQLGAEECLFKPFSDTALRDVVDAAPCALNA